MKISFLVVLYNKNIIESTTLISLSKNLQTCYHNYEILVWNNGPTKVVKDDIGLPYSLMQDLDNRSLSNVYNEFIDSHNSDKYVLLDDDTELSKQYIDSIYGDDFSLLLPDVMAGSSKIYPLIQNVKPPKYISIGSGICLTRKLADRLKYKYSTVFDERFLFYGVDTTFFYRVNKINTESVVNTGYINHSLSRLDKSTVYDSFRLHERCADLALQNRYYPSTRTVRAGIKFLSQMICRFQFIYIYKFLYIFLVGRHPNNKKGL